MIIKTYEKLNTFLDMFASGVVELLIIESSAGLGKSYMVRERLKGVKHLALNSHVTPLMNFKLLYRFRNKPIWYDDVDFLFLSDRTNVSIMKQICETSPIKRLDYFTTYDIGDIPMSFETMSKVLITLNCIEANNPHITALKDRGFYVQFKPFKEEIFNKMIEVTKGYNFLEDKEKREVLGFIEEHASECKDLTLRTLIRGFQLYQYYKLKGVEWREDLLNLMGIDKRLETISIKTERGRK